MRQDTPKHLFVDLLHVLHGLLNHREIFVISFSLELDPFGETWKLLACILETFVMSFFLTSFVLVGILGAYGLWVALLDALSSWHLSITGIFRICVCLLFLMDTLRDISYTYMCTSCDGFFHDQLWILLLLRCISCEFCCIDHKCHSKLDPYLLLILLSGFYLYCLSLLICSSLCPLASSSNLRNLMLYIIFP